MDLITLAYKLIINLKAFSINHNGHIYFFPQNRTHEKHFLLVNKRYQLFTYYWHIKHRQLTCFLSQFVLIYQSEFYRANILWEFPLHEARESAVQCLHASEACGRERIFTCLGQYKCVSLLHFSTQRQTGVAEGYNRIRITVIHKRGV